MADPIFTLANLKSWIRAIPRKHQTTLLPRYVKWDGGFAPAQASVTAIKALVSTERANGMTVALASASDPAVFQFVSASTATGDDVDVLVPSDVTPPAAGRWHRIAGTGTYSTATAFRHGAVQTVTSGASTQLFFPTADLTTSGITYSAGGFVVAAAGLYAFSARCLWEPSALGTVRSITAYVVNSVGVPFDGYASREEDFPNPAAGTWIQNCNGIIMLGASEAIYFEADQDSGGALGCQPYVWIQKIG